MEQNGQSSTLPGENPPDSDGVQNEALSSEESDKRSPRWIIRGIRESVGLDGVTMLKMLKAGLPPTIVIAM